jgi:hypothetical protein
MAEDAEDADDADDADDVKKVEDSSRWWRPEPAWPWTWPDPYQQRWWVAAVVGHGTLWVGWGVLAARAGHHAPGPWLLAVRPAIAAAVAGVLFPFGAYHHGRPVDGRYPYSHILVILPAAVIVAGLCVLALMDQP